MKGIQIHPEDHVMVALENLDIGDVLEIGSTSVIDKEIGDLAEEKGQLEKKQVQVLEPIKSGHKVAIKTIQEGEAILKYGHPIGTATQVIPKGAWVHTHNMCTNLNTQLSYTYMPEVNQAELSQFQVRYNKFTQSERSKDKVTQDKQCVQQTQTFQGFKRKDGRIGVRNDIWIIPSVGCMNSVALAIAQKAEAYVTGSVGRVIALTHPYGCSQMGEDEVNTKQIIANLARHPNAGGVLVLGLGCENCGIVTLMPYLEKYDSERIRFLQAQDVVDEVAEGVEQVKELIAQASQDRREQCEVSDLIVGLKCGGSDGLSGITANPVVGVFSDLLVGQGGATVLTEVPEMFGAETLLFNRCIDEGVFEKAVEMINTFKAYFERHHQVVYENPSPGNKAGGISTLEDKSLGCTQKSGSSPVVDVLAYGEQVKHSGLQLLSAPGNDLVAATALAAAGAQIILFTTGRGTPFASPVPTIKIASNTALYEKKRHWIDFNAGEVIEGVSVAQKGQALYDDVLAIAEGKKVQSEKQGYFDMAIFKQGVTL